jgi:hypothetical protein
MIGVLYHEPRHLTRKSVIARPRRANARIRVKRECTHSREAAVEIHHLPGEYYKKMDCLAALAMPARGMPQVTFDGFWY